MDLKQILGDLNTCKKNFSSAARVLKEIFNEACLAIDRIRFVSVIKCRFFCVAS